MNVSFRITDVNDNVPEFDVMTLNASLPDGTLNGTLVHLLTFPGIKLILI